MKKVLKIFAVITVLFVVVFIGALASIPLWLPFDKVKDYAVKELSEMTGREIGIEKVDFNILKGFEIRGFYIRESKRYGDRMFIKDDYVVLKYNLFALLRRDLVIHQFELNSPYIQVIKETDTRFNFTDIMDTMNARRAAAEKAAVAKGAPVKQKKEAAPVKEKNDKKPPINNIIVTSVKIRNGNFVYVDYSSPQTTSVKIENLNFAMDDLITAAIKPVSISMSCLAIYNEFKIPVSLKSELKGDFLKGLIDIKLNPLSVGGINTTGGINIGAAGAIKGRLVSVSNTKKMFEILPDDLAAKVKDTDASIDVVNTLDFALAKGKPAFKNTLELKNGTLAHKGKKVAEAFSAKFDITNAYNAKGSVKMKLAGQDVSINLTGENVNIPAASVYRVDVHSPKLAVEYLLAMFPQKEKPKKEEKKVLTEQEKKLKAAADKAKAEETRKALLKLQGKASPGVYLNLRADSIFYKDITIGRTISNIRFVSNKLTAETSISAYQGNINNNITMDIEKETYSTSALVKGVIVDRLIDDMIAVLPKDEKNKNKRSLLDDIKGKVYGNANMKMNLSGATFRDVPRTIKGSGNIDIKNGRLKALDMGKDLAKNIGASFLAQDMDFDTIYADFSMAGGRIDIKNMKMQNGERGEKGDIRIRGQGYTTVDRAIDMRVETDISPGESKNVLAFVERNLGLKDASYAVGADGWLPFDFRIYNTLESKKYDYNQKRMVDNITRNLKKRAEQEAGKFLEKEGTKLLEGLFNR
ncbi:MAG TPA: AsmA family protein [bacterium]|nr:AsmA family protein [bacterium]